ncbi:MAG TPA: hypothetical protein VHL34_18780 [Rhizomicrobium sp.]|jgi:hypothetical protein|nr:hypothetical protein [Rhizomicrobium sp.]
MRRLAAALLVSFALTVVPASVEAKPPSICDAVDRGTLCAGPLTLDFDGDGVADSITLVSARGPIGVSAGTTVISNLWGPKVKDAKGALITIRLGKSSRGYLLMDQSGFFDSPIWQQKPLPLEVAKRGSKAFNEFRAEQKAIRHDILVLGTEAGIDIALYWDGKTFKLFEPVEEP